MTDHLHAGDDFTIFGDLHPLPVLAEQHLSRPVAHRRGQQRGGRHLHPSVLPRRDRSWLRLLRVTSYVLAVALVVAVAVPAVPQLLDANLAMLALAVLLTRVAIEVPSYLRGASARLEDGIARVLSGRDA